MGCLKCMGSHPLNSHFRNEAQLILFRERLRLEDCSVNKGFQNLPIGRALTSFSYGSECESSFARASERRFEIVTSWTVFCEAVSSTLVFPVYYMITSPTGSADR